MTQPYPSTAVKAQPLPYIIQGKNIILVIKNKNFTISDTHVNYTKILDAIKQDNWEIIESLTDVVETIEKFSQGNIRIKDGEIYWKGEPFHNALSYRILQMIEEGFDVKPMMNFMENLMLNPSKRSVDELYGFLEKSSLPITPDGCFLAFKKVKENYMDVYTGTIDNSVGKIVSMERNQVNDDKDQTCSAGLHFCSKDYLGHFSGARIMILKINPRDVVSIPSDYNDTKGRCCLYEVIGELESTPETAFKGSVDTVWTQSDIYYDEYYTDGHWTDEYFGESELEDEPVVQKRDSRGRFLPKG